MSYYYQKSRTKNIYIFSRSHFSFFIKIEANAAAAAAADAIASVEAQSVVQQAKEDPVAVPALPGAPLAVFEAASLPAVQVPLAVPAPEPIAVPGVGVPAPAKNELAKNLPGARIVERRRKGWVKKTWEERLEELKAYKAVHGDANVPTLSKENPSLGHWVHDQRKQYRLFNEKKQTAMTTSRIEQLEVVGFKWALQRHTTMKSWNERFEELKAYKAEKGNCNIPIRFKGNPTMGQWVSTQRQEYRAKKKGNKTNITEDRIKSLEEVGFVWSLRDTSKMAPRKSWDDHYQSLVEFKENNGHCDIRVRSKKHPTGSLGRWVEKQRDRYNSRSENTYFKISPEQIKKLEDLGFKWRVRNEKRSVVERREALKAKAAAEAKAEQDAVAEAKAQEETAAAVAAEVAATVQAVGVSAADVAAGVMPPVPGVELSLEVPVSVPVGVPEVAAAVVAGMEVDMEHAVANVDVAIVDNATVAAMEASVQAAVDANASMEVDGVQVPVPEPVPVPEVAMKEEEIPVPEYPSETVDVAV